MTPAKPILESRNIYYFDLLNTYSNNKTEEKGGKKA